MTAGDAGKPSFDPRQCFVRVTQVRADGFIEFEFAVGDPLLSVDLILPAAAYREFCATNGAVQIPSVSR
ncbi:hypothetical protein FHP25_35555 [Vineibacter terrae]|uniref:Phenol hydroxylase n=1 Tax=Vineibacter terrae TaxID=2586908 RepID=A0A5C8PA66_9HYPH|nr:phenol hydroxylase subunit [Vineibacter terrae]TXL70249.1 hypothetical protein FHP25_35555 [Vineibacter terrae]